MSGSYFLQMTFNDYTNKGSSSTQTNFCELFCNYNLIILKFCEKFTFYIVKNRVLSIYHGFQDGKLIEETNKDLFPSIKIWNPIFIRGNTHNIILDYICTVIQRLTLRIYFIIITKFLNAI